MDIINSADSLNEICLMLESHFVNDKNLVFLLGMFFPSKWNVTTSMLWVDLEFKSKILKFIRTYGTATLPTAYESSCLARPI